MVALLSPAVALVSALLGASLLGFCVQGLPGPGVMRPLLVLDLGGPTMLVAV